MLTPCTFRRLPPTLAAAALALALTLSGDRRATAQEPVRVTAGRDNEAKPLLLAADEVATWTEGGEQVVLLRGKAMIEQGVFVLRADRALLWIDTGRQPQTRSYRVQIVADGAVRVEEGPARKSAPTIVADLVTQQDVRLRSGAKTISRPPPTDSFLRGARALRPQPQVVQQVAAVVPVQNPAPAPPPPTPSPGTPLPTIQVPQGPGLIATVPGPPGAAAGAGPMRNITIQRRTDQPFQIRAFPLATGEKAVVVSGGGVIMTVRDAKGGVMLDIEADRLVVWTRGDAEQMFDRMRNPDGSTAQEVEFYLAGNVELRSPPRAGPTGAKTDDQIIRAAQVYYDVRRNVAVALDADLQVHRQGVQDDIHMTAEELVQVTPTRYEAVKAHIFASRLPSDPGVQLVLAKATMEEEKIERRGLFGQPINDRKTGQPETYTERLIHGEGVQLQFEGVPVMYLPVVQGDANDPFGPLEQLSIKNDRIFGTQLLTTFNVWNLLNRNPVEGTRWMADLDYLSRRGPATGTQFEYGGKDLFGLPGRYEGLAKLYGMYDDGTDILGGGRGEFDDHPLWRGRVLLRHNQTIWDELTIQGQLSLISDTNFLEQYYKQEFDADINNETYLYLREQRDQWATTLWTKFHVRNWETEDVWLPRADGYLIGRSFFDLFTYNAWGSAGYAELRPTSVPPPPTQFVDRSDNTGRFDLNQELSLPFYAGPVKLVPYGVLDLTYYTQDLEGEGNGRLYGGGGVRGSMPLSRLYPNVQSDLFNLNGIYHKVVLGGNYYIVHSSDPFFDFPQLDRLNDDATDQALRDIRPVEPIYNPAHGLALATSPVYDPSLYAIRRLIDDRIDTKDTMEVYQADIRQRWQTKRGFPGMEHTIDYLTLDLSASFFPHPSRDNFGKDVSFLEYDTTWNVGDRTAVVSSGLYDPVDGGPRIFTIGGVINRPDRTSFSVSYRQIDPIDSRAVITAATYVFSPKYAVTASSVYDFGTNQSLANSFIITRIGSDLTMNLGLTYNAVLNNFGVTFEILPNIVAASRKTGTSVFGRTGGR